MRTILTKFAFAVPWLGFSAHALADFTPAPEPGTLWLLAIGGVVALATWLRNHRD
jgi:hypothetical protein